MSHFDKLISLPKDFVVIAATKNSEFAGIAHQEKPIFGLSYSSYLCGSVKQTADKMTRCPVSS